jgi:predicted small integral membrane protein
MTKYLRIKFIAYIAIYSTFSIIINSLTYPTIGVNDDEFFSQLVSGDYTGNRESFTHIAPASPQWFFGFIVVGGEWFCMWQSEKWNGVEAAFRFVVIMMFALLFTAMPESENDQK